MKLLLIFILSFALNAHAAGFKVNVQGYNADVDTGTEDVNSAAITLPTAVAATTVVSADAADDAAGTGARTIKIEGLNSAFRTVSETIIMDGTTPVNATYQYLRINSVKVLTVGSGAASAGAITVKHTATVIASLEAGEMVARTAVYTAPLTPQNWIITKVYGSISNAAAGAVVFTLMTRTSGGLWLDRFQFSVYGTGKCSDAIELGSPIAVTAGEDVKITATAGADNIAVFAGFDLKGSNAPL